MPRRVKSRQKRIVPRTPTTRDAIQDGKYEPATVMSGPWRQPERVTGIRMPRARAPEQSSKAAACPWFSCLSAGAAGSRGRHLARAEREGHRGIEDLDLRLHLLEARAAQLSARGEEI